MTRMLILLTTMIWAAAAQAQDEGSQPTREFVAAAAHSDQYEILAGRVALVASTNLQVRNFSQHMIDAHRRTTAELQAAAARANLMPPPDELGEGEARMLMALQGVSGPEFDRVYVTQQTLAHLSALTVEQSYAQTGDEPNIQVAAQQAVPLINEHLQMAEALALAIATP